MGKITIELLRKRSEHNEGEVHSLEELALHQEKLHKIELIDKTCRDIKILLLQNNAISKIENVKRLKNLEYLNLALNIIERIENLEGCESLKKLDLTLNFVAELTSVKSLTCLQNLEQLYLTGNPCYDFLGYRDYVIAILPQLRSLDGREITQTERINACQKVGKLEKKILDQQEAYFIEQQMKNGCEQGQQNSGTIDRSISANATDESNVAYEDDDDSDFWNQKSLDTPEIRKEMIRRIEKQEEMKKPKDPRKVKPPRKLVSADGKPYNINEPKIEFLLTDNKENQLILDLAIPKHLCTTLIDADVQPLHVKVTMKGKVFQILLPEEVKPDSSSAQRSQVTGHLIVTMPKVHDSNIEPWRNTDETIIDLRNNHGNRKNQSLVKLDEEKTNQRAAITSSNVSSTGGAGDATNGIISPSVIKDEDVPPLI